MDPARSERPATESLTATERDARIEQLLLSGLDHYFAADFDQAINLWTRVLFLDRAHDRARAYIERARSAQAERQREAEALMHQGLDALTSGEVERARTLVSDALARGASRDLALGVLDRIERLGVTATVSPSAKPVRSWFRPRPVTEPAKPTPKPVVRRGRAGVTLLALAALGAAAVAWWGISLPDVGGWLFPTDARATAPAFAVPPDTLPLPAASELYLARSRALFKSGHLRDALRELDRVSIGDVRRADADRLRAEIQVELLAAAAADSGSGNEPPRQGDSRPMNEVP